MYIHNYYVPERETGLEYMYMKQEFGIFLTY